MKLFRFKKQLIWKKALSMCLLISVLITLGPALSHNAKAADTRTLGVNIGGTQDYDGNLMFADAMKTCRGYKTTDDSADASVDKSGWPSQDFSVVVWHGITRMNGSYALSFNGQASVTADWGDCTLSGIKYDATTNTSTATLTYKGTNGNGLKLVFKNTKKTSNSSANTGVTNIKLMRPITRGSATSHAVNETFSRGFKAAAGEFKVLRFMDYSAVNSKLAEVNWSDRVLPSFSQNLKGSTGYGWQGKGGSWEYVVMLCNELNCDAWINVPVAASDDYIKNLANLLKYGSDGVNPYTSPQASPVYPGLKSGLNIYVEYCNELWNTGFSQTQWIHTQAVAEVNAGNTNLNFDDINNEWNWTWRYYARRTVEISDLFRGIWGDLAMGNSIRPVLEWQQGDAQATASVMLYFIDAWYNNGNGTHVSKPHPVNYYIYGGSGSSYYGPDGKSDSLTIDNIWTTSSFNTENWVKDQSKDASLAAAFGIKRTAYEGGPSMDNVGHSESVKAQAWSDSRMKAIIIDHQKFWEQYNGDVFCYYSLGGNNSSNYFYQWNMTNDICDAATNAPKFQAIQELNAGSVSASTIGTIAPATVQGNCFNVSNVSWINGGTSGTYSINSNTKSNNVHWLSYNFLVTKAQSFNVKYNYTCTGASTVDVIVDGKQIGTSTVSSNASKVDFTSSKIALGTGLHSVMLKCKAGSVTINSVSLTDGIKSNSAPTVPNYSISSSGAAVNNSVTAIDTDGDALTYSIGTSPTHGTVTIKSDGSYTYTPASDYSGTDRFTVLVSDGNGATATSTITITINKSVNTNGKIDFDSCTVGKLVSPYTASGYKFAASPSTYFHIFGKSSGYVSNVLVPGNWKDKITISKADGTNFNVISFDYGSDPWNELADATITGYKADGTTYTETISSNTKTLRTKTLHWTNLSKLEINYSGGATNTYGSLDNFVLRTNTAPVAVNDEATTTVNTSSNIAVITNDTDADKDTLIVSAIGTAVHGTTSINTDGTVKYTPALNYSGTDCFTYTVSDGNGGTATGTVNVTIKAKVSISFDSCTSGKITAPYSESGYKFVVSPSTYFIIYGTSSGYSSNVLLPGNWNDKITVSKSDGTNFNIVSFDYGSDPWNELADATITGYKADGTTYTATISANSKTLSTKTLNWTNLSKIEINYSGGTSNTYGSLDNFIFN